MSDTKIYPPIQKQIRTAFGRRVFLLGRFTDGYTFWLEEPKWDCGWYWAFGYIETYTQTEGPPARDIQSHQHYNSLLFKTPEHYNVEKQCWTLEHGKYLHKLSDHKDVLLTVLNDNEEWLLSDLMKMAYTLRKTAELYRHGTAMTSHSLTPELKRPDREKEINEIELPLIFKQIETLLTPKE